MAKIAGWEISLKESKMPPIKERKKMTDKPTVKDHEELKRLFSDENVQFAVPKDMLKSMFYMFTGKPDSAMKLFHRPIVIKPTDIAELNLRIKEKLETHQVQDVLTSVDIGYRNNKSSQMGDWDAFDRFRWDIADEVEHIIIRWDFLLQLNGYKIPQRHTLVVKISSGLTPAQFMQLVFSQDHDEMEKLDKEGAPCFCRVDFINHILSQELIALVDEWNKSRNRPNDINPSCLYMKKQKSQIARIVHYSVPFLSGVLSAAILKTIGSDMNGMSAITVGTMITFLYWILATGMGIAFFNQIGHFLASRAYSGLNDYGTISVFEMTNGDKNRKTKIIEKNRDCFKKFMTNSIVAIVLNLIAAGLAAYLFVK